MSLRPAVFLDRDNTLIANDGDLGDPASVRLLEGVAEGVRSLRQAGYRHATISTSTTNHRGLLFYTNFGFRVVDSAYEFSKKLDG